MYTIAMRIKYRLIKTNRRLTFDILEQNMKYCGVSDEDYLVFKAKNGIEIISRSRMDIQTDRLWLIGCSPNERSGSMVFSSDEKRDREFERFQEALTEWANNAEQFNGEPQTTISALGLDTYIL
jgi:hypothetical protein